MAIRKDGIEVRDRTAVLIVDGQEIDSATFAELTRLYDVTVGDDVSATDEECFVAVFGQRLWVLPFGTPGINALLFGAWYADLCASRIFFKAMVASLPWTWRRRVWGVFPLPEPRLGCFPLATLPSWREVGPVLFAELPRPTREEGSWATTK